MLDNKLGIDSSAELAREEERITKKKAIELFDRFNILYLKDQLVSHLSGGEKQRVAIARALIKSPKIILADEPTGSLNFEKGIMIMELLKKCHEKSKQVMIFVTHDDRMAKYADVVIHFEDLLIKRRDGNV